MLRILGRDTSSNVQKVLWAAGELGLDFEREDIGGAFGGNDTPEYLALNPNGYVPTLIDGDYTLWESNSIVRYLAATHGSGTLWPTEPRVRGSAERWMGWQIATLSPTMVTVFRGLVRTPPEERDMAAIAAARDVRTPPEERDMAAIAAARDRTARLFAMLDAALAGSDYVAGASFTVGDIPVGIAAYRWYRLDIEREDFPNLERWYGRLTERPAYREHIMKPLA